jgi:hypothetical protein
VRLSTLPVSPRGIASCGNRWKEGEIFAELFRQRLYAIIAWPFPKWIPTAIVTRYITRGNILCTNPGPIPYEFDRLGPVPVTDFYGFSQMFPPGRIMLVFTTFRGSLRLGVMFDRDAFPEGVETAVVDPLIRHLSDLIRLTVDGSPSVEVLAPAQAVGHAVFARALPETGDVSETVA